MKRTPKGSRGYVRYEKVKRALIALLMFAIPLIIFFTGLIMSGTRKNLLTVVAILGVIPAARFAVSWIMIMLAPETPAGVEEQTETLAGDCVRAYELTVTAYEGRMPLDALVIRSGSVACLSLQGKKDLIPLMEKHIETILKKNGIASVKVKIFPETKAFYERIGSMGQNDAGSESDEKILAVIKAISL